LQLDHPSFTGNTLHNAVLVDLEKQLLILSIRMNELDKWHFPSLVAYEHKQKKFINSNHWMLKNWRGS